jgi:hypothetical protein
MGRLATTDAIDVSNLASELADYYQGNRHMVNMNLFYADKWRERFTVMDDVADRIPLINTDIDLELRPQADYTDFSAQNDAFKIENRYLQTEEIKLDLLIVPRELKRSYFSYAYQKGTNNFDMGFVEFFFMYLTEKIQEKMHLKAFYQGVRDNAGTTTVDTMDGMLKVIADEITATTLTPVATGVVTASNIVDSVEAVCDASEAFPAWADRQKEVLVSTTLFNWYWQKRRELYPNLVQTYAGNISGINRLPIEGFNAVLVKEPGLGSSQRIISTPKENKVLGFDSLSDWNNMDFEKFNRTLKVMVDFKCGFNFNYTYGGSLIVNDQA